MPDVRTQLQIIINDSMSPEKNPNADLQGVASLIVSELEGRPSEVPITIEVTATDAMIRRGELLLRVTNLPMMGVLSPSLSERNCTTCKWSVAGACKTPHIKSGVDCWKSGKPSWEPSDAYKGDPHG